MRRILNDGSRRLKPRSKMAKAHEQCVREDLTTVREDLTTAREDLNTVREDLTTFSNRVGKPDTYDFKALLLLLLVSAVTPNVVLRKRSKSTSGKTSVPPLYVQTLYVPSHYVVP